jgi:hypothetical protein
MLRCDRIPVMLNLFASTEYRRAKRTAAPLNRVGQTIFSFFPLCAYRRFFFSSTAAVRIALRCACAISDETPVSEIAARPGKLLVPPIRNVTIF